MEQDTRCLPLASAVCTETDDFTRTCTYPLHTQLFLKPGLVACNYTLVIPALGRRGGDKQIPQALWLA